MNPLETHILTDPHGDPCYRVEVVDLQDWGIKYMVSEVEGSFTMEWSLTWCREEPFIKFKEQPQQILDYAEFLKLLKWLWNDACSRPGASDHINPIP